VGDDQHLQSRNIQVHSGNNFLVVSKLEFGRNCSRIPLIGAAEIRQDFPNCQVKLVI
jgi:hypothetical protein